MDKKLLEALDNLSYSLELIADALNSRESSNTSTTNALKSGDFSKQLNEINTSLKSIKSDTSKILQNQNTILELSKKDKGGDDVFLGAENSSNKEKLKSGAASIILIAGAVLAIGLAFKIVGEVDFLSVISIGLAIVFISDAFVNVSNNIVKNKITNAVAFQTAIVMVAMSAAIMLSSWVLGFIKPISLTQAVSAILIAGMFSVISYGMKKILDAMDSANIVSVAKSVIFLPLILPAIATAIVMSSYILGFTKPIGLIQAISAILIAGVFTAISYGLPKIMNAVSEIKNPLSILTGAVVLVSLAGAIAASSVLLGMVQPITLTQFITSIAISILFVALSYGLALMSPMLDKISWKHVIMLPLLFTTMSLAIMASSKILSQSEEITFGKSLRILVFGAVMSILTFTMGTAMVFLGKAQIKDVLAGALAIVVLAGAIALSSKLLNLGDYKIYPSFGWAIGTGVSIIAFGVAALTMGLMVTSGIGAVALLAGAVAIVGIAGTIVAVSHILKAGDYSKYPSFGWAAGVGLSMGGFGMAMLGIGLAVVGSLGLGLVALEAGKDAVLMIAQTVVDASHILKAGDYKSGPTIAWSGGIALALAAFSPIYAMLAANKIMSLFGGGVGPKDFSDAIKMVSGGIVTAAEFFGDKGDIFKGGPKKEWSQGVGLAIGAFLPVYRMLAANKIMSLFGGGIGPKDFVNAIKMVSEGIVSAGEFFNGKGDIFKGGPKKEWSQGVGGAIGAFLPIFKTINDSKTLGFGGLDVDDVTKTILGVTNAIVKVAIKLNSASRFFNTNIDPNFVKNLTSNTLGFLALARKVTEINDDGVGSTLLGLDSVSRTANGMIKLAGAYDKLASSLRRFSGALKSMDDDKISSIRKLTGNLAILASMNKKNLDEMMGVLESKANVFSKLIQDNNETNNNKTGVGANKKGEVTTLDKKKKSKYGNTSEQLDLVIDILTRIDTSTTSLDEFMASKGFKPTTLTDTTKQ